MGVAYGQELLALGNRPAQLIDVEGDSPFSGVSRIMLAYFKRAGESAGSGGDGGAAAPKRPCTDGEDSTSKKGETPETITHTVRGDPSTIVTWNANGLGVRLGKNWEEFEGFMEAVKPDVCCIQEVRLAALGPPKCKKDDDAGRKRGQLKVDTTADRKDRDLVDTRLHPLARRLGYRVVLSLANYKYSGTAALVRKTCPPSRVFYDVTSDGLSKVHHREGRVIALEYASFTLVALYVPNNGVTQESFRRREQWDANLRSFVDTYDDKRLIVIGDLNVAHGDADLTHPSYFKHACPAADPRNNGQPGCTPAERERHSRLLACGGGLIDAYRHLYPAEASEDRGSGSTDTPGITWRGTAGNEVAAAGRFYGKGMRIDCFLVSSALAPRVAEVKVFGSGADREGFLGSDHSPLMLTLRGPDEKEDEDSACASESAAGRGDAGSG